jgi:hypothetical protein
MNFNFSDFLYYLSRECHNKEEALTQIQTEIEFVNHSSVSDFDLAFQHLYLKRLENIQFYFEKGSIKENDIYNSLLMELFRNFQTANSA